MEFLNDAKYLKSHEWVRIDGDIATVGISDFAQSELGGIVFVNLPQVGDTVEAGVSFADVESVKSVSDVFSPLTGTVCEINEEIIDNPQLINDSPYSAWFIKCDKFTLSDELMNCEQYKELLNRQN